MNNQRGLTLLEMILVIGLMTVVMLLQFFEKSADMEQSRAKATGSLLFTYNNAVRSWISANPGAANGVQQGSKWLKLPSCGGTSSVQYLACDFPVADTTNPIPFGRLSLSSTIATTGTSPNQVTTVTTLTSPFKVGASLRSDLAGVAAITAAAGASTLESPVLVATDGKYTSSPMTSAITLVASSNAQTDSWLRTDGSNTMNNNITFNSGLDANHRQLLGVSRIQSLAAQAFYIGENGGALLGQGVIVDADQSLLGVLTVHNVANAANALVVSQGNISLTNGSVDAKNGYVNAAIFYDSNNSAYRVDPSDISVLNNLNVNSALSVAGKSSLASTSVGGQLDVNGRANINELLNLSSVATQGAGCASTGLFSRDAQGKLLSCQGGVWASNGGVGFNDMGYYSHKGSSTVTVAIPGQHTFCALIGVASAGDNGTCDLAKDSSGGWLMDIQGNSGSTQNCHVACAD